MWHTQRRNCEHCQVSVTGSLPLQDQSIQNLPNTPTNVLEQSGTWSSQSQSTSVLPSLSELFLYIIHGTLTLCHTGLQMITHRGTHVLLSGSFYCICLLINLLMLYVCARVYMQYTGGKRGKWIRRSQRRTGWRQFSPSTAWVPGIELKT